MTRFGTLIERASRNRRATCEVALLVLLVAAVVLSVVRVQPVSALVVLAAMCVVPGAAFVAHAGSSDPVTTVALAVGLSLALDTAVATALAWSGWWHPEASAAAIGAGAAALLIADLRRALAKSRESLA